MSWKRFFVFAVVFWGSAASAWAQQGTLILKPASLTFTAEITPFGTASPAPQSVSVSSTGAALSFAAAASTTSGGKDWLRVSPALATTPATLTVSVNPAGLAAGTYSGAITLNTGVQGETPQTVAITLTVSSGTNPVPTITSLSPASRPAGGPAFVLTVIGSRFVPSSAVRWNGVNQTTTFVSGSELAASVPAGGIASEATATITVTSPAPGGGPSNVHTFPITPPGNPVPSISSFSPGEMIAGGPGFNLTLFGSNFLNSSKVRWNGEDVDTTFLSSIQLRAAIPAGDIAAAGRSDITVFNPTPGGGISNTRSLAIDLPIPLICCLDPISAVSGGPEFTLTVYGSNFVSGATVFWNGATRPTELVSTRELRATIPASDIATSGTATVTVLNPAPGSGGSQSQGKSFAVLTLAPGVPVITSVSPRTILAGGPGFVLTVNGSGFIAASVVRWNGQNRPTIFDSGSQLRAEIPASDIAGGSVFGGSTFGVTVSNQTGSSAPNQQDPQDDNSNVITTVTLNPVPRIEGFSPASAVLGRPAFSLLVDGGGFISASKMKWNGTEHTTDVANNTRLRGEIAGTDIAVMRTGVVTVANSGPGGGEAAKEFTIETNSIPAAATLYYPRLVARNGQQIGLDDSESTGVAIANLGLAEAELTIRAFDRAGIEIRGEKIMNPIILKLPPMEQRAIIDFELFGKELTAKSPVGWIKLESTAKKVGGFFLAFDNSVSVIDGADVSSNTMTSFVLPEIEDLGFTQIHVANPATVQATITFELYKSDGARRAGPVVRPINPNGAVGEFFTDLFPGVTPAGSDYIRASSTGAVVPFEYLGRTGLYVAGLNGQNGNAGATTLYCPQYVTGGGFRSTLSVVNLDSTPGNVTFALTSDDGAPIGLPKVLPVAAKGKIYITDQNFFVDAGADLMQGFVKITSSGPKLAGAVVFGDPDREAFSSALPLVSTFLNSFIFGQVASDDRYYTGIAIVNPNDTVADATIEVFDSHGTRIQSKTESIRAKGRKSRLLTEYFPALINQNITSGYIKVTVDKGVASFAVFGTNNLSSLSAVPPQVVP